jgi:hypothetical protein
MSWDQIKDYMNSFIGIIFLTLPFFFIPEIKRSKTYIVFFILATVFLLWLGTDKMKRDEKQKKNEISHSDSVINKASVHLLSNVDSALKVNNLSYNPRTKTVTIIDTVKLIDPVMDVIDDSTRIVGVTKTTAKIEIDYKCINDGIAFEVSDHVVIFYIMNGKISHPIKYNGIRVSSLKAKDNRGFFNRYGFEIPSGDSLINPVYVYFKAIYSNKELGGKIQPPLRRIYQMNIKPHPKTAHDFSITAFFGKDDYIMARKLLIKDRYW